MFTSLSARKKKLIGHYGEIYGEKKY